MDAQAAREWLRKCDVVINLNMMCKECGLDRSNVSKFLSGNNTLSQPKYEKLINHIQFRIKQIIV